MRREFLGVLGEDERGVGATEAKAVRQCDAVFGLARGVRNIVEIALWIGLFQVDRGRHRSVEDRQNRKRCFHTTGCPEHVSRHRLGGRHRQLARVIAEHGLDRDRLCDVSLLGRGAVRVDVANVGGGDAIGVRLPKRHPHAALRPLPTRRRQGDVIGVGAEAVADDLRVDLRAAGLGLVGFLSGDDVRRGGLGVLETMVEEQTTTKMMTMTKKNIIMHYRTTLNRTNRHGL